ncbi:hypothetical protein BU24DRAFT_423083 [Aaosphaeria arxii CBS 175.79]|uniref:Phenylacetaldoxime dehydratase n=1 Tax=Aaosphaeria arxii CBS 175.79 TaxID=1450172 RepID=A0A6A5XVQ9_9PLEO|nr:uncharacterized protein BU24DRAFT_423083 [Aaosphaeria arxii CBS 175.79]KAF2016720.1 hypothetical protein BU24DRAFT_423083 [Aaosphaeria arxii CBS 175.79]
MSCPVRLYPLHKPKNHTLPIPRWNLKLPESATHIFTTYLGIQNRSDDGTATQAQTQLSSAIDIWLKDESGPDTSEPFTLIDGGEHVNSTTTTRIWVCYWLDATKHRLASDQLSLPTLYSTLDQESRASIGIWRETFKTAIPRLETNYSGLDYLPGLARLPGAQFPEHDRSAYWGAARDRIPNSAHDLFPRAAGVPAHLPSDAAPRGIGQHLLGTNFQNIVHIRSGQFWKNCGQQEADAYEKKLEPTLHEGLRYLWEHPEETEALSVRYLRNEAEEDELQSGRLRKETCGAAFFSSLDMLERWAKTHRSHLAIYRGALAHYKQFGDYRRLRTWHEVSVLEEGDAVFEYINCLPETGVIKSIELEVKSRWTGE